jgi:hypothetical protein
MSPGLRAVHAPPSAASPRPRRQLATAAACSEPVRHRFIVRSRRPADPAPNEARHAAVLAPAAASAAYYFAELQIVPEVATGMQRSQSAPLGLSSVDQARPERPPVATNPCAGAAPPAAGCGNRGCDAASSVPALGAWGAPWRAHADLQALPHARAALACQIREKTHSATTRRVARPLRALQAPWDDLELGRLLRNDACGRTYHATFQGTCVTAKARAAPCALAQLRPLGSPGRMRRTPPPPGSWTHAAAAVSLCTRRGRAASPWTSAAGLSGPGCDRRQRGRAGVQHGPAAHDGGRATGGGAERGRAAGPGADGRVHDRAQHAPRERAPDLAAAGVLQPRHARGARPRRAAQALAQGARGGDV